MGKEIDDRILAHLGVAETGRTERAAPGPPGQHPPEPVVDFKGTARFEVIRKIGEGGMGVVYEAHDRQGDTRVALKVLRHLDAEGVFRFKNEFRALQDISHPGLVSLGELFEDEGRWFFTMELVEGQDFLEYVRRGHEAPGFAEHRVRTSLRALTHALIALHDAGKVHRDIKPSNIRVTPEGRVVLLDFGLIAETRAPRQSVDGTVVGTAAYMAPEQALSNAARAPADWYAVGALLYEVLTGQVPFSGPPMQVLLDKQSRAPTPAREIAPGVPADLTSLCMSLLLIDPARRPDGRRVLHLLGEAPADDDAPVSDAPFVGRDDELDVLRSAFAETRRGEAVAVYVHGESGVGKSVLIRHFLEELDDEEGGTVVLTGRCYERESVPYKALDGVVDALSHFMRGLSNEQAALLVPRNAALLPRIFPVLGRVEVIANEPGPAVDPKDPHELRSRVFAALRELLVRLADRRRVVIAIDDLQWSDADSALLLADLMRPPDAPQILLLVSSRRESRAATSEGRVSILETQEAGDLEIPGTVRHIALGALADDSATALAEELLHRSSSTADAAEIVQEAKGHPLYIAELVRLASTPAEGAPGRLRLDDAIWARVSRLDELARRVLELVAMAAAPLTQEVVRDAAQMPSDEFSKLMTRLRVDQLVRSRQTRRRHRIEPYHDRVREAVQNRIDAATACARHDRLAIALETATEPARPELLLRHLEGAGRHDKAARYAAEAARLAAEALAFDRAAELYRSALRLGEHTESDRRDLLIALAAALANAGRGVSSAEVYLDAAEGADPVTRRECRTKAAQQLLITGHIERGLSTLGTVLEEVGETLPSTPRRALLSLLWQRLRLRTRGLGWKERHEREIADSDVARLDVYVVAGDGLGMVDPILGIGFHTRHLIAALDLGETKRIARALAVEGVFSSSGGRRGLDRGRRIMADVGKIASDTNDGYLGGVATLGSGLLDYFSGNFRSAADMLKRAERTLREESTGSTMELNNARLMRLLALAAAGEFAEMGPAFERYLRDAGRRGDRYVETSLRRACSYVWFAADMPEQVRRDLELTSWTPPSGSYHLQHYYGFLSQTLLAVYEGKTAEAIDRLEPSYRRLRKANVARVQMVRVMGSSIWGRAMLGLTASDGHRAEGARRAEDAARRLAGEGVDYATVYALLIRAALASQRGKTDAAVAMLERAAAIADETGMSYACAAAHLRLGELLGGDEAKASTEKARAWAWTQGIKNPERMMEMMAPGF